MKLPDVGFCIFERTSYNNMIDPQTDPGKDYLITINSVRTFCTREIVIDVYDNNLDNYLGEYRFESFDEMRRYFKFMVSYTFEVEVI